ncbi:MAG: DmsE family decaheme c-type cytochrome [Desulfuromonadales bacterium]|nr:MAG: DmsE family decaheme c-type cytochrome [Desulfuromonadales bacterium]
MNRQTMRNKMKLLAVVAGGLLLAGSFSLASGGAGFVGNEKCKECHDEVAASHGKSLHARAWSGKGESYGCESCHGAAGEHVSNPSKSNIIGFGKESKASAEQQSKQCLECHSATVAVSMWDMGLHKKNDVACSSCHSIHKDGKVVTKDPETCFTCHKDIKRDVNKQSHHPIIEGKIKCSSCHNPHGTLSHGMIKDENINQLCYQCHADKRGPFIWEHPPVEENCLSCHGPHGTKAAKLLKEKVPNLCQNCHGGSGGHNVTPYDATAGFKGSAAATTKEKLVARSCLNCHTNIHGSMAPASGTGANGGKAFAR